MEEVGIIQEIQEFLGLESETVMWILMAVVIGGLIYDLFIRDDKEINM
tara:strand:- start:541 stop:684 length:144 start_codon:yes stop_codon:yes gene_type:complete